MKSQPLNSVNWFQQLIEEINKMQQAFEDGNISSLDLYLMEERDVLQYLKICKSTLNNYRKKKILKAYNYFGRNVYFRHEVYEAILKQLIK